MSRCKSCDKVLNDVELGRKDPLTGDFLDLCGGCYIVSQQVVEGTYIEKPEYAHYIPGDIHYLNDGEV